jgi:hypothetical protein
MDEMISRFKQIVWDELIDMVANVVDVRTPSRQSVTGSHVDDDDDDEVPRAGGFGADNLYDFYEAKDNQATTPFMPADSSSTSAPTP